MRHTKHVIYLFAVAVCVIGCSAEQRRKTEEPKREEAAALQRVEEDRKTTEQKANEGAPKPQARPAETVSSDRINVTIFVHPEFQPDGHVVICGETNLPQGTELMISLQEQGTSRVYQSKCSVVDGGKFRSESLGPRNSPLPKGAYVADVVMPITRVQPAAVRQVVGDVGEKLTGPLIVRDRLGVSARSYDTSFAVREEATSSSAVAPANPSPANTASSELDRFKVVLAATNSSGFIRSASQDGPTLILVVSEEWRYGAYAARLEAAYQTWRCWATIRSPNDMNAAFLMLLDQYGNNVGGSRLFGGGSRIWVDKN